MRKAKPVMLSDSDQTTLEQWTRSRTLPARQVERARIVLLAAEGRQDTEIADEREPPEHWRQWNLHLMRDLQVSNLQRAFKWQAVEGGHFLTQATSAPLHSTPLCQWAEDLCHSERYPRPVSSRTVSFMS